MALTDATPMVDPSSADAQTAPRPRRRGRPRRPGTDEAILRAMIELMMEGGADAASVDAIAARSGAAKSTIYRRWPSRDLLILDAMRAAVQWTHEQLEAAEPGEHLTEALVRGSAMSTLALAQHPVFKGTVPTIARELLEESSAIGDRFRDEVFRPLRAMLHARLEDDVARGAIRSDIDVDLLFDLVNGAVLYRALLKEPLDESIVDRIVELVLGAASVNRSDDQP